MDERRIEDVLRAGPPGEARHRQGALARGLAEREGRGRPEATFDVRLRPRSGFGFLGIAAAAVLVAVTVLVVITRPGPAAAPSPSLSPSSSASPSPSPSRAAGSRGAPVELVDRWAGPLRSIPGLENPATRAFLVIQGAELRFDAGPGQSPDVFRSSIIQARPDVLQVVAGSPSVGCEPFDEGTYRWALSPAGTQLTLTLIDDACASRAAALPGRWTHTACRDASQDCLGPIEAGTHESVDFDPNHTDVAGQLTYTVPDGWANSADHHLNYSLRPAADYLADPGFDGGDTVSGIYVWAGTMATDQPADCAAVPAAGVDVTAKAIADHIATLDGIVLIDRRTTEIDGRPAFELDIDLSPAYAARCPWSGGDAFRSLIMFADVGIDGGVQGIGPGGGHHIWFVDVGPSRVVSIWVEGDRAGFDTLLKAATPIVESMHFGAR